MRFTRAARAMLVLVLGVLIAGLAPADVVTMHDGRTFEGEIIKETTDAVTIDAKVGAIRMKVALRRHEIESIERTPVHERFFDPPPAESRPTKAGAPPKAVDEGAYLMAPMIGALGVQSTANGLERIIRYARRHRIGHIVLMIDSQGGDVHQAGEIYDLIKRFNRDIQFHAIVRDCRGAAIAAVVLCNTIAVVPGAMLGGTEGLDLESLGAESAEERLVYRSAIGDQMVSDMAQMGRPGEIARAMIDPAAQLVAWRNEKGTIEHGLYAPAGLAKDDVIVDCPAGKLLTLTHKQAVALGIPSIDGTPASLGALLGIDEFYEESDFGTRAMRDDAQKLAAKEANENAKYAEATQRNIEAREKTHRYLERSIQRASEWSPDRGEYSRYESYYGWGWGGGYSQSSSWSKASQEEWKLRTDNTLSALTEGFKAARTMARLDREAVRLGLEPTYAEDELRWMVGDLQAKRDALERNRNRKGP